MTHICVGNLTIIGSDNGLSPVRRQAITWTNVEILLIGPLGTNFSEMLIEIHTFSLKKIHLKMSSGKMTAILSRPQCVKVLQCMKSYLNSRRQVSTTTDSIIILSLSFMSIVILVLTDKVESPSCVFPGNRTLLTNCSRLFNWQIESPPPCTFLPNSLISWAAPCFRTWRTWVRCQ